MEMKLLLWGAGGKLARAVIRAVADSGDMEIAAGVDPAGCPGAAFPVYTRAEDVGVAFDCVVDVATHTATADCLALAMAHGVPALVAVTGFTPEESEEVVRAARTIPVFRAPNLSVGMALLRELVRRVARVFPEYDTEIVEAHRAGKRDAPGGSAMMLAAAVREGRGRAAPIITGRRGDTERAPGEIGVHALRMGDLTGQHTVYFTGEQEQITLSHTATDRSLYAAGALRAIRFLCGKPAGLYGMPELLGVPHGD